MKNAAALVIGAALSGCAINQAVNPVAGVNSSEVCIVENPAVRDGFLQAYRDALNAQGCLARVVPSDSGVAVCPTTSTYVARWSWDLALYMSYADIEVYQEGRPVGSALYDSTGGGGRLAKFVDAEEKTQELVAQLYPNCRQ